MKCVYWLVLLSVTLSAADPGSLPHGTVNVDQQTLDRECPIAGGQPQSPWCLHARGTVAQFSGNWAESLRLMRAAESGYLQARESARPLLTSLLLSMGENCKNLKLWNEAQGYLERTLTLHREIYGPRDVKTAEALASLGGFWASQGEFNRAESLLQQSVKIFRDQKRDRDPQFSAVLSHLLLFYTKTKRPQEALSVAREALEVAQTLGENHPSAGLALSNLAGVYVRLNEPDRALPLLRKARAIWESKVGEDHPYVAQVLIQEAYIDSRSQRPALAEPALRRAIEIFERKLPPDHFETLVTRIHFAEILAKQSRLEPAESLLTESLAKLETLYPDAIREAAVGHAALGHIYVQQGQTSDAEQQYATSLSLFEKMGSTRAPEMANLLDSYAKLISRDRDRDRRAMARGFQRRAKSMRGQ